MIPSKGSIKLLVASALVCSKVHAFAPTSSLKRLDPPSSRISKKSVIVRSSATADGLVVNGDVSNPKAWECDEEANCVQVDACDEESCRTTLDVRIHNQWYDLSGTFVLKQLYSK